MGFIMAAASQLDDIDALCYVAPVVQPFLKYNNILELDNKVWVAMVIMWLLWYY